MSDLRSRVVGSLIGGAIGDALGEPVEFMRAEQIFDLFGPEGVTGYSKHSPHPGAFTDDTQMTLWTAEGLIRAQQRRRQLGCKAWDPVEAINTAYLRWLLTQKAGHVPDEIDGRTLASGWLIGEQGLWDRMAPGNTCLSAMRSGGRGTRSDHINDSKGCGGVMRAAPAGLIGLGDRAAYDLGADLAALTHGHPAGYISAGALALILERICAGDALETAVDLAIQTIDADDVRGRVCADLLRMAIDLAGSSPVSCRTVERLGAGWVAEEALAISVYAALVAEDFRHGVLLAVNHSGDSDSTGSICGQILGASLGVDAIPPELIGDLRLGSVVSRIAHDLYQSFHQEQVFPSEEYPTW